MKINCQLPVTLLGLVVLSLSSLPAQAQSLVAGGYQETVFSVSSAERYQAFFEDVAGWEVISEGVADPQHLRLWGLPDSSGALEIVMGNPGTERGYVRLVQFLGVEQQQIRSNAQSWDTGGWFDVNTRILSMERMFAELQTRDWQAVSDPVEFTFGPFVVKEWLARGPDGIVIAMIERVAPPLEGWPLITGMSRFFNATQIVSDIEAAREFYVDKLGFKSYLEHHAASKAPGPNVLGLPHNLATEVPRIVSIVHPDGINEGSVELLQFEGVTGADWSTRAFAPNLGILMLRFPVTDMQAFYAHAKHEGLSIIAGPEVVSMLPYGQVEVLTVSGPDGALIEFIAAVDE